METPETIREFWFGGNADDGEVARAKERLWWGKDAAADEQIRRRFRPVVEAAARRELEPWSSTADGRLALILLADQMPRAIWRGTPRAFAYDPLALSWCRAGLAEGIHQALRPIERVFFFLPLEHSESVDDQEAAVALFEDLAASVPREHGATFEGFLDFAVRHRDIIARCGRFPHRNRILCRESTAVEIGFLELPGSSF